MNKIYYILWVGAFVSVALYWGIARMAGGHPISFAAGPCSEPLTYKVGEVDSRFAITEAEIYSAMEKAGALWSAAAEKNLAEKSENGNIVILFVYDEEQKIADSELRFREQIKSEQLVLDNMQAAYENNREQFDARSKEYLELAGKTTEKLNTLNEWVRQVNDNGGFSGNSVHEFEQRKAAAEQMQKKVLDEKAELDRKAAAINREIELINRKVEENNKLIDRYNREFAGENRFTKATYQRTGNGGIITVNQFLSRAELPLILAHELGHALGLSHVSSPQSVMHSKMGGQQLYPSINLSSEDRQAILKRCGK